MMWYAHLLDIPELDFRLGAEFSGAAVFILVGCTAPGFPDRCLGSDEPSAAQGMQETCIIGVNQCVGWGRNPSEGKQKHR